MLTAGRRSQTEMVMTEDQKKAQERAVYLATQQIIEHLQKSLDKYGDNDYK